MLPSCTGHVKHITPELPHGQVLSIILHGNQNNKSNKYKHDVKCHLVTSAMARKPMKIYILQHLLKKSISIHKISDHCDRKCCSLNGK